jgi:putative ABC transport system permease protein
MASLLFDIRDACRALRRDRGYTATVVLTLALTIGAATAMFSIVNGVLLKPLAYREAHQLVTVREVWREFSDRMPMAPVNERHFEYWREHARSFETLAQYLELPANLTGAGEATQIVVAQTSGSLFDVLGVTAALGRTLTVDDERRDRSAVVVIGDGIWRRRFSGSRSILGTAIAIDGRPMTVVGVLPADFRLPSGEQLTGRIDAFVPLLVDAGWVGDHNNLAVGRLRAGVTVEQARAELDVLQAQVSEIATKEAHEPVTLASVVTPLAESVVGSARRGLLLLFGAIAAVLMIACSNLANLSLTRAVARMREAAIRSALGAGSTRLMARAVLEQLVLAVVGGAAGLWIAWFALAAFVRTAPLDLPRVADVALDGRVLLFAAAVSIVTGLLVAIAPALRVASRDVQTALRSGGAAVVGDRSGARARAALLTLQIALSVSLLSVTGLLSLSFLRVIGIDRGFVADRVLVVGISMPAARYTTETVRQATYDRLLSAVRALPDVRSVTTTSMLPLSGGGQVNFIVADGTTVPMSARPSANFRFVAPEYFQTLGMTLRRGRSFTDEERDPARALPSVISEPLASRLWPGEDPIGRRFSRGIAGDGVFEVVGVTADARVTSVDRLPPLMVYVPYWWRSRTSTSLLVKSAADPAGLVPAIRRTVAAIDPEIAIGRTRTLDDVVDSALASRRYQAELFIAFGAVALLIATVGVYAMTAQSVSRRRREMNIRSALGASRGQVLGLVIRQSSPPIIAGVAGGLAGALGLGGVVANLLFEVRARDPWVLSAVTIVVAAIAWLSTVAAARQGLSLDPAAALRED